MLGKHSATELQPKSFSNCFLIASFMQTRMSLYVNILCWPQIPYSLFASCGIGLQASGMHHHARLPFFFLIKRPESAVRDVLLLS